MAIAKPALWAPGRNLKGMAGELWQGCVGCWPLWEGAGATVYDLSVYRHHGTLQSMDPSTDWVTHTRGRCLDFDGSDDEVDLTDIDELDGTAHMTVFLLAFCDSAETGYPDYIFKRTAANSEWGFQSAITAGTLAFILADGVAARGTASAVAQGVWHAFGVTFDGTGAANADRLKMWIDGTQQSLAYTGTIPVATDINAAPVHLASSGVGNRLLGKIALATLWNRSLSAAEMTMLSADPFCMVRPPVWEWGFTATGAAAVTGSSWYNNLQQSLVSAG